MASAISWGSTSSPSVTRKGRLGDSPTRRVFVVGPPEAPCPHPAGPIPDLPRKGPPAVRAVLGRDRLHVVVDLLARREVAGGATRVEIAVDLAVGEAGEIGVAAAVEAAVEALVGVDELGVAEAGHLVVLGAEDLVHVLALLLG